MFAFFRKYQKIFLGLFTALIVISFFFYGTASTFSGKSETKNEAHSDLVVQGQKVNSTKLANYTLLFTLGSKGGLYNPKEIPWLLSDDFFFEEFIQNGFIAKIVALHEDILAKDFEERLNHAKKSHLFAHPQVQEISLERIWSYFAPELLHAYRHLKTLENPTTSQIAAALANFWTMERKFPIAQAKQILANQIGRYSPEQANYFITRVDINPLGFETLQEYFGEKTIQLAIGHFLEIADGAKNMGSKVSKRDIKKQMLASAKKQLQRLDQLGNSIELSKSQVEKEILRQLTAYNITKTEAKSYIADLIHVRNYWDMQSTLPIHEIDSKDFVKWHVKKTELGENLQAKSYTDFLAAECYLEALYKDYDASCLAMPCQMRTQQEILQEFPEIMAKEYTCQMRYLHKIQIAARIPLKEIIEYQMSDDGWKELVKVDGKFMKATNLSQRMHLMERLDPKERQKLDQLAASKLLETRPSRTQEMLQREPWEQVSITLVGNNTSNDVPFIKDKSRFITLLRDKEEFLLEDDDLSIEVKDVQEASDFQILDFAEAKEQKVIDTLLRKKIRDWKIASLDEAKAEEVCKRVYGKLIQEIAAFSLEHFNKKISDTDRLISLRFAPILAGGSASPFLAQNPLVRHEISVPVARFGSFSWNEVGEQDLIFNEQNDGVALVEVLAKEIDTQSFEDAKKSLEFQSLCEQKLILFDKLLQQSQQDKSVEYRI